MYNVCIFKIPGAFTRLNVSFALKSCAHSVGISLLKKGLCHNVVYKVFYFNIANWVLILAFYFFTFGICSHWAEVDMKSIADIFTQCMCNVIFKVNCFYLTLIFDASASHLYELEMSYSQQS